MEKITRKIIKVSSHSYAVVLPKELIKAFGWKERQKLTLRPDRKKREIKIQDWKSRSGH